VIVGDVTVADYVSNRRYCVEQSEIDLFGDFDGVIDLDAEISNRAFELRMTVDRLQGSCGQGPTAQPQPTIMKRISCPQTEH